VSPIHIPGYETGIEKLNAALDALNAAQDDAAREAAIATVREMGYSEADARRWAKLRPKQKS
jgi:hypothetical protein